MALEIKPDKHEAWRNLAATYQHRSAVPRDPQAQFFLGIDNAILAAALQKTTPEQDFLLAREVWGAHGRWAEAQACIDRLMEVEPVGLAALCYAAEIAINLGEIDDAEAFIERVRQLEPNHPEALYPLARLLKQRGQASDARKTLREYYDYRGTKLEYRKQMETARLFRELDDPDYAGQACIGAQVEV
ncbi:MAG: tetratricopeptide repeat protein, partial [Pseudomonadota bacterium]